jgi:hypothetical protein
MDEPRKISRVGDLMVYRRLVDLHMRVHDLTLTFPKFEMYELGSQVRRSSNSAPANLAEGFNNTAPGHLPGVHQPVAR